MIRLEGVEYAYRGKFQALCGIDLSVYDGESVCVIGANGCGKSTLLHLVDGLIFPDKGRFLYDDKPIAEKDFNDDTFCRAFRKRVGLVFQNPDVQLFCPTVKEDILFGPLQLGIAKAEIERRLEKLVSVLGLSDLLERAPYQLSIGEKKKAAIASTLIIAPDLYLLDEPTAGIDPMTTRTIIDLFLAEHRAGRTLITSTHDLHAAADLSDTVYVLSREKRIAASGSPADILKDTGLLQEHNLVHIHAHEHDGSLHRHAHQHWFHHRE